MKGGFTFLSLIATFLVARVLYDAIVEPNVTTPLRDSIGQVF